jgi:hypothetical protein
MFIGHYAPAFALKAVRKSPSLAACFVAVQLLDIGFFSLAYFGVEKWRPDSGLTGIMPVDLYFMPFTHSLLGSAIWALAAAGATFVLVAKGRKVVGGAIIGALVLSHWLLDLVVHRSDLGLVGDGPDKRGFGLWNLPAVEMPLEIGLVLTGFFFYLSSTRPRGACGRRFPWVALAGLLGLQAINWFGSPPTGAAAFSGLGLFAYAACVALAWGLDRTREPRPLHAKGISEQGANAVSPALGSPDARAEAGPGPMGG